MPFVYTPVVGAACKDWYGAVGYSGLETGVYIDGFTSAKADMVKVLETYKSAHPEVQAIVVTDGERILGLGGEVERGAKDRWSVARMGRSPACRVSRLSLSAIKITHALHKRNLKLPSALLFSRRPWSTRHGYTSR